MAKQREVRLFNPGGLAKPAAGYSHAAEVTSGRTVYVSGQVALDVDGALVGENDFAAQTRQVFENLKAALAGAGSSFGDVIKLNIYCDDRVDRARLPEMRAIRDRYVNTVNPPASTLVFVSGLARAEWLIEIEAVAVS